MICRFLLAAAFQAAGGETETFCAGALETETEGGVCVRGERRGEGHGKDGGDGGDMKGEERPVRSRESGSGDGEFAGAGWGDVKSRLSMAMVVGFAGRERGTGLRDVCVVGLAASGSAVVRSRVSTSGVGGLVLLSRGEVRRGIALVFGFSVEVDDLDEDEDRDALDEMDVRGGRARVVGAGCGAFNGDERVRSRESMISDERRSCGGVGMGASSKMLVGSRSFVGVWEARHVSSVVCRPFPGDAVTDAPRLAFVSRVFAFLVGICDGEGCAGKSTKSNVSIVSTGSVSGRSSVVLRLVGRVFERCMGALLLRFVTLAGRSSSTGGSEFSRTGTVTGGLLCCRTGEEDSRSITAAFDRAGWGPISVSCDFANPRDSFDPGLVTFAKLCIPA